MEWAILTVSTIAAIGVVVGIALPLFQQRRRVWLGFTSEFRAEGGKITFVVKVKNRSSRPIYELEVGPAGTGESLGQRGQQRLELRPGEERKVNVTLPSPAIVDVANGPPQFKTMIAVIARYGDRLSWVSQPAGPYRGYLGGRTRVHHEPGRTARIWAALRRIASCQE